MELPCDICMWGLIPMIKRELVLQLYKEHKLSKVFIAKKLGITKGSVTQYTQGKRAADSNKLRKIEDIDRLICALAKDIAKKNLEGERISKKFCDICKLAQKNHLFSCS
jgi:uncharacterized protein